MPRHFNLSLGEAVRLLHAAFQFGINFFDTAVESEYGDSEWKIGQAFKNKRDSIIISSKARAYTRGSMKEAITLSLRNLQTDYIDIISGGSARASLAQLSVA